MRPLLRAHALWALAVLASSASGLVCGCERQDEASAAPAEESASAAPPRPAVDDADPAQLVEQARAAQRSGDDKKARAAYERACNLGDGYACVSLAELLEEGRGGAVDFDRARSLYEQACASGASEGCDALGH